MSVVPDTLPPVAAAAAGDDAPAAPPWFSAALRRHAASDYPGYLLHRCDEIPDRTALVCRGRRWSYRALRAAVEATAQRLAERAGAGRGTRVVINVDNGDDYVILYLAAMLLHAVVVPVNPRLTAAEVEYVLGDAQADLYVHDAEAARPGSARGCRAWSIGALVTAGAPQGASDRGVRVGVGSVDDPAVIFYTSGTTGRPKGVVHTHRALVATALQAAHAWGYAQDGLVNLAITPLFHIASHSWSYPTLAHVGTLVVDSYGTERIFELIREHGVQGFGCVPSMLMMMLRSEHRASADLGSVENVRFGASPMPPDKLQAVQAMFPRALLYHGMGQTESGGTISVLPGALAHAKVGSTGLPLPGCEVRIVDDEGRDLPAHVPGEVLARGPNLMLGYHERPEATADTLRGGWLHTGDVGYRDDDGMIYLVDRKKDMIIRGGENIYSVEVENVLLEHARVPACAVIGLADEILGERVCVVIDAAEPEDAEALAGELQAWCRTRLAAFKVPEVVLFLPGLPRTATGKTQKASLRRIVEARRGGARDMAGRR